VPTFYPTGDLDRWARFAFARPKLPDLILRTRIAASRKMNGTSGASWFETALRASSP